MYTLVRRFIKTAIGFLAAGVALGVWMLVRRELWGEWPHPYLVSAHAHAVLVGFVMFLILGVALWLFAGCEGGHALHPRRGGGRLLGPPPVHRGAVPRRDGEGRGERPWLGWVVVAGGAGQAAGLGLYFWTMWTRIRPVGSQLREAKGERF